MSAAEQLTVRCGNGPLALRVASPRDVCAVCVCGYALRCSESFGWRNELAHRPGRARGSFAFGMGSVHGRMPARSARADPPQRRACGVRIWPSMGRRACASVVCPRGKGPAA
eukprot:530101-Prymnesium_polylepis.2